LNKPDTINERHNHRRWTTRKTVYVEDLFSKPVSDVLPKDDRINTKDGIDHINLYSRGHTELGQYLSNFAYTPIQTEDGRFNSIEAYWYWLNTHNCLIIEMIPVIMSNKEVVNFRNVFRNINITSPESFNGK